MLIWLVIDLIMLENQFWMWTSAITQSKAGLIALFHLILGLYFSGESEVMPANSVSLIGPSSLEVCRCIFYRIMYNVTDISIMKPSVEVKHGNNFNTPLESPIKLYKKQY